MSVERFGQRLCTISFCVLGDNREMKPKVANVIRSNSMCLTSILLNECGQLYNDVVKSIIESVDEQISSWKDGEELIGTIFHILFTAKNTDSNVHIV